MTKQLRYRASHPWVRFVEYARRRCRDRQSKWFKYYGANGIACLLDSAQVKTLWERDRGDLMERPSLDRIDPAGHYSLANCRFIEFNLNSRLARCPDFRADRPQAPGRCAGPGESPWTTD
jgi:hypothetical protein